MLLNRSPETVTSMAMPGLAVVDPLLASEIARYGLDMAIICDIGKQATYAILINSLITMIHRAFCRDNGFDRKLYEVRTRKILMLTDTQINISRAMSQYGCWGRKEAPRMPTHLLIRIDLSKTMYDGSKIRIPVFRGPHLV